MAPEHDTAGEALRLRALSLCLRSSALSVRHYRLDGTCDLSENLPDGWPGEADPPAIRDALSEVTAGADPRSVEIDFGRRAYEVKIRPDRNDDGRIDGTFAIISEITENRERERAIRNLLREVSHRSRNLLAIVQAVAVQTANYSSGTDDFVRKFRGRLEALASTQDLVTASDWRGARFRALAAAHLSRLGNASLKLEGDDPMLRPNAALHVGLALHELGSNAMTHGDPADIHVTAELGGLPGHRTFTVSWTEALQADDGAHDPHFGAIVLERIVPHSVSGSAHYQLGSGLVRYRLTMPSNQFEEETDSRA